MTRREESPAPDRPAASAMPSGPDDAEPWAEVDAAHRALWDARRAFAEQSRARVGLLSRALRAGDATDEAAAALGLLLERPDHAPDLFDELVDLATHGARTVEARRVISLGANYYPASMREVALGRLETADAPVARTITTLFSFSVGATRGDADRREADRGSGWTPEDEGLWAAVVTAHTGLDRARATYFHRAASRVERAREVLRTSTKGGGITTLGFLETWPDDVPDLVDEVVGRALIITEALHARRVLARRRDVIVPAVRESVLRRLDGADDFDVRRLAELLDHLADEEGLRALVAIARQSDDPDILEAVDDYDPDRS
ncbi:hypothetical protein ACFP71_04655 [Oerskovia paurometabola]|uniref:Uncharacterized protein n=2 Tax=Oerskovia paurometabola TaxID=162170 RepID=A0ABW1X6K5_9CELL|nr:hypothetical protein [Oerskovia paurometabola]MBM7495585.1 hypothetical protein [Oerskovia paurometabola]